MSDRAAHHIELMAMKDLSDSIMSLHHLEALAPTGHEHEAVLALQAVYRILVERAFEREQELERNGR